MLELSAKVAEITQQEQELAAAQKETAQAQLDSINAILDIIKPVMTALVTEIVVEAYETKDGRKLATIWGIPVPPNPPKLIITADGLAVGVTKSIETDEVEGWKITYTPVTIKNAEILNERYDEILKAIKTALDGYTVDQRMETYRQATARAKQILEFALKE